MSYIDDRIVSMRKDNCRLRRIQRWVVKECPYTDEQICLARMLRVLDEHNMAVSKAEVYSAFRQYYNRDFHGDTQSYLTWLCETFKVKTGTITTPGNSRAQGSKKKANTCITAEKHAQISKKIEDLGKCTIKVSGGRK